MSADVNAKCCDKFVRIEISVGPFGKTGKSPLLFAL